MDTPPTLAGGLCLLGTRSGTVDALRAKDGQLAWRLQVAPEDERIVAFGQVESPWPVAGSVLVVGDTAYIAAGRHPLAYGGIRILALDTATGAVQWVKTINGDTYDRAEDDRLANRSHNTLMIRDKLQTADRIDDVRKR